MGKEVNGSRYFHYLSVLVELLHRGGLDDESQSQFSEKPHLFLNGLQISVPYEVFSQLYPGQPGAAGV